MCGIAGTIRIGDRDLVERMAAMMSYRGPDDQGCYEDGDVRLSHRRLSIIDLSHAGHQPMESDDGQLVIVFNGEIYNYQDLRATLAKHGYQFRTATDTETIIYAYRHYGLEFVRHLEGMFAFALWDRTQKQLVLARDRTGIKPLFYYADGDAFAFASELKPLLLLPGIRRTVNRRALRSAIRLASNIEYESMLASVFKVRPGCLLIWRDGRCEEKSYWEFPTAAPEPWTETVLIDELRRRLTRTVRAHMVSDAPLGAALSGGLDSSAVVAIMAQSRGAPIDTFTVGHGADDPDLLNARIVAEHCRTNHHEILVASKNITELLPAVIWHLEEPLGQMESVQMYLNYREAAKFARVLLIGEGADECFAGYDRYRLLAPRFPLTDSLRRDLYQRVYMYADRQAASWPARVLAQTCWGKLPGSPLLDPQPCAPLPLDGPTGDKHVLERALSHDRATYLHHLSLKRADALGMAHSVELRVPFLDRDIVDLASRIPARFMIHRGIEKYILRRAVEPLLPREIAWRRKRGFQMRLNTTVVDALAFLSDRLLRPADVKARGFFEPDNVTALWRGRPGRFAAPIAHKVWSYRVWSMLLCEMWARIFLDRPISAAPPSLADIL